MDERLTDADWLRAAYETRSHEEIARELGCSRGTVRNRMVALGIERRSTGAHFKGRPKSAEHRAKMSAAKRAYWEAHPDREAHGRAISEGKSKARMHGAGYCMAPWSHRQKSRLAHRVVMEQALGRPLERHEIIHHVNGDKTDNRPENLAVMTQSEHAAIHDKHRERGPDGRVL